jgi:hypothetical protein
VVFLAPSACTTPLIKNKVEIAATGAAQYDAVLINLMLIVAIKSHVNMRANILNMIFSSQEASQEVAQEVCYPLRHLNYFIVFCLKMAVCTKMLRIP